MKYSTYIATIWYEHGPPVDVRMSATDQVIAWKKAVVAENERLRGLLREVVAEDEVSLANDEWFLSEGLRQQIDAALAGADQPSAVLRLSPDETARFDAILSNPPPPTDELVRLMRSAGTTHWEGCEHYHPDCLAARRSPQT